MTYPAEIDDSFTHVPFYFEPNWASEVNFSYTFNTAMGSSQQRFGEQRRAILEWPKRNQKANFLLDAVENNEITNLLSYAHDQILGVPIYHERFRTTTALLGATTIEIVEDISEYWNLQNLTEFLLLIDRGSGEAAVKEISSINGQDIELVYAIASDLAAGDTVIFPLFLGYTEQVKPRNVTPNIVELELEFKEILQSTGFVEIESVENPGGYPDIEITTTAESTPILPGKPIKIVRFPVPQGGDPAEEFTATRINNHVVQARIPTDMTGYWGIKYGGVIISRKRYYKVIDVQECSSDILMDETSIPWNGYGINGSCKWYSGSGGNSKGVAVEPGVIQWYARWEIGGVFGVYAGGPFPGTTDGVYTFIAGTDHSGIGQVTISNGGQP